MERPRPVGVTAAAIVYFVDGTFVGWTGLRLLVLYLSLLWSHLHRHTGGLVPVLVISIFQLLFPLIMLAVGYIFVKTGIGLWKLRERARAFGVVLAIPTLGFSILALLVLVSLLSRTAGLPDESRIRPAALILWLSSVLVHAAAIWYLSRSWVREAFVAPPGSSP